MTCFQAVFELHTKKTKFPPRASTSTDMMKQYIHPLQENVSAVKVQYKLR